MSTIITNKHKKPQSLLMGMKKCFFNFNNLYIENRTFPEKIVWYRKINRYFIAIYVEQHIFLPVYLEM